MEKREFALSKKILTDAEIEFVKNAERSDEALWSLWASKETAYKVINKTYPDTSLLQGDGRLFSISLNQNMQKGKLKLRGKTVFSSVFSPILIISIV